MNLKMKKNYKIYDCFLFYNELDMLELKLTEMYDVVDKFVLLESCETFQGSPKKYFYEENKHRYARFSEKIIHIKLGPQKSFKRYFFKKCGKNWSREYYQRDQLKLGLVDARPNDLVIISDVDEIISGKNFPKIISSFIRGDIAIFEMPLFQFSVNYEWIFSDRRLPQFRCLGPRMVEYKDFKGAQMLRKVKRIYPNWAKQFLLLRLFFRILGRIKYGVFNHLQYFEDAGWHFTSMGDWKFFRNKVESFAHEDWKIGGQYLDESVFEYFTTAPETTRPYPIEKLPKFIQENRNLFLFR
ncbi:hypothetical protein [Polynucleobacter sp.]|uniref:hypothetical protein n=1 Tax=Polynucleobacter sp. TaxID=2029855 RepID=UPI0025FD00C2|nr:hypothetical protein [Polynucleobacter sp.]